MIIYHEAPKKDTEAILQNGLQRTSKGLRSQEQIIIDTNDFLDDHRPPAIIRASIWRNKSIYGFVGSSDWIIEIQDGKKIPLAEHLEETKQAVFRIIPNDCCYLSDLDQYDIVKQHLQAGQERAAIHAAQQYWERLIPLRQDQLGTIRRPEAMIPCDLAPSELSLVHR